MTYRLIHDELLDHPALRGVGNRSKPYSDCEAFIWLIHQARREPGRVPVGDDYVELQIGDLTHSFRFMANAWKWDLNKVRRFLDKLKRCSMIDTAIAAGQLLISLCNFSKYQVINKAAEAATDTVEKAEQTHYQHKNHQSNKKTLEPDGSREVIGAAADRSPVPPAGPKSLSPKDRQFLGTDAALPGQLPLPGMPDLLQHAEDREPVTVPDPVEDDAPELPVEEPDLFPPEPDPTIMQAPAPARPAPQEVGAVVTGTVVALPKPAEIAEQMRAIWNEECADLMPEIRAMPPKRLAAMTKALRTFFANDLGRWRAYCQRLRRSPFMTGDNNRGWVGNIDTCIRADIITKALEGNYDDREQRHANRPEAAGALRGAAATMDLARRWLG